MVLIVQLNTKFQNAKWRFIPLIVHFFVFEIPQSLLPIPPHETLVPPSQPKVLPSPLGRGCALGAILKLRHLFLGCSRPPPTPLSYYVIFWLNPLYPLPGRRNL